MGSYRFGAIFNYDSNLGILTPRFNVSINGIRFAAGTPITRFTSFGGLNLFNYIGRGITGNWDAATRVLTISGFY